VQICTSISRAQVYSIGQTHFLRIAKKNSLLYSLNVNVVLKMLCPALKRGSESNCTDYFSCAVHRTMSHCVACMHVVLTDFVRMSNALLLCTISTFLCRNRQLQLSFRMLSGIRTQRATLPTARPTEAACFAACMLASSL